jgi:adenine-specific DNA glycosylase
VAVALMRGDQFLALQRGEEQSFAGMWELPRMDSRQVLEGDELTPGRVLFDLVRVRPGRCERVGEADSTFTHHKITTELYRARAMGSQRVRRQRHVAHKWVTLAELADLPASKAQRRLFEMLADGA